MNSDEIRERIKSARLANRFSQETFAGKIGISANSYGDIENGKTRLIHPKLPLIARELNISVEYLLFGMTGKGEFEERVRELEKKHQREIEQIRTMMLINQEEFNGENSVLRAKVESLTKIIGVLQDSQKKSY
ncbi:MAG: helix-turn-helix domain-containing protein [Bacteroidia bacterium]|nr:helix-turn-helix domain-containing protein [Bacteroidia bacterium]